MMATTNILVCEDERIVATEIDRTLRRNGFNVVGLAQDGQQALDIAEREHPDLALMDIRLPGLMDGIETAGILREHFDIPSVFLTAFSDEETVEAAKQAHPLGYLTKPIRENELNTTIEVGLSQHRFYDQEIRGLEKFCEEIVKMDVVESAVNLERQFMFTEGLEAQRRVVGNLLEWFKDEINAITSELEMVKSASETETSIPQYPIQGARLMQKRVLGILNELRYFTGPLVLQPTEFDVAELIDTSLNESLCLLDDKVSLIRNVPQQSLTVFADFDLMNHALTRVIENASAAVSDGGVISVTASRQYEELPERFNSAARAGWYAVISVQDSGVGMSLRTIERAFEPFFSKFRLPMSVGLGLPGAYGVLQHHRGWLSVESEIATGTQVSIFLPELSAQIGQKELDPSTASAV